MSSPHRPPLKLKLSGLSQPPTVSTPVSSTPKLTLKFSVPQKPAPAVPAPASEDTIVTAPKPPRKSKKDRPPRIAAPTAKKRDYVAHTSDDDEIATSATTTGPKRIKLKASAKTPSTPVVRLKTKGKPPPRPLGVGYDSEASDCEEDPSIEEEFILRMLPGDDCDYLRSAVENKRWGPRSEGGADVRMKFLEKKGRRAIITIRGRHYAASLVDMPCIVEGMKSWDRKGWWKTGDICQMLLVLGPVKGEEEVKEYPLPQRELNTTTWQYAHGLTAPMHWVRKRRFRKRISNHTIEAMEAKVDQLVNADEECENSRYEVIDLDRLSKEQGGRAESEDRFNMLGNAGMQNGTEYGYEDADGEMDEGQGYFDQHQQQQEGEDDALEADFERALMESDNEEPETNETATAPTPANDTHFHTDTEAPTPAADTPGQESSDEESEESDEDAGDDEDKFVDEDVLEQQADEQRTREEIADLEAAIKSQAATLDTISNDILKKRIIQKIQSLQADLALKKAAIGEDGDD